MSSILIWSARALEGMGPELEVRRPMRWTEIEFWVRTVAYACPLGVLGACLGIWHTHGPCACAWRHAHTPPCQRAALSCSRRLCVCCISKAGKSGPAASYKCSLDTGPPSAWCRVLAWRQLEPDPDHKAGWCHAPATGCVLAE